MDFKFTKLLRTTVQGLYRQLLCFLTISILPDIIITWGVTRAWGNTQQDCAKLLFQILGRKENGVKTHKTKTRKKEVSCLQRRHNSVKKIIIKATYERLQIKSRNVKGMHCSLLFLTRHISESACTETELLLDYKAFPHRPYLKAPTHSSSHLS